MFKKATNEQTMKVIPKQFVAGKNIYKLSHHFSKDKILFVPFSLTRWKGFNIIQLPSGIRLVLLENDILPGI